jgi:hypothetical protein
MIFEENRADQYTPRVLLLTSNPVFKEQIKGIIIRIGGAVKVISRDFCRGKRIDNQERVVLHCI